MLGGLHIEQHLLRTNGKLNQGTSFDEIVQQAGLSITGLKTAICDVNHIKKARYALRVLAPCLVSI